MLFIDLPVEIISLIGSLLNRHDLVELSTTCRFIYKLLYPLLAKIAHYFTWEELNDFVKRNFPSTFKYPVFPCRPIPNHLLYNQLRRNGQLISKNPLNGSLNHKNKRRITDKNTEKTIQNNENNEKNDTPRFKLFELFSPILTKKLIIEHSIQFGEWHSGPSFDSLFSKGCNITHVDIPISGSSKPLKYFKTLQQHLTALTIRSTTPQCKSAIKPIENTTVLPCFYISDLQDYRLLTKLTLNGFTVFFDEDKPKQDLSKYFTDIEDPEVSAFINPPVKEYVIYENLKHLKLINVIWGYPYTVSIFKHLVSFNLSIFPYNNSFFQSTYFVSSERYENLMKNPPTSIDTLIIYTPVRGKKIFPNCSNCNKLTRLKLSIDESFLPPENVHELIPPSLKYLEYVTNETRFSSVEIENTVKSAWRDLSNSISS